jgi:hypothetical protein
MRLTTTVTTSPALRYLIFPHMPPDKPPSVLATTAAPPGPSGNDPDFAHAIFTHERIARLSIEFAVSKARQVLALVQSWG